MDTPMSEANNKIVISDVSSKSDEEEGQSSESEAPAPAPPEEEEVAAPPEMENNYQLMMIPEHDREYGCRYCHKRFSNKQALGGHQNAHKVERAMEKNVEETGDAIFFGGHSSYHGRMGMSAAPFLSSYHRPSEFLHRSLYNWNFASQQQAGGGVVHYNNPRPPPPPPAAGFNCGVYHGWSAPPAPRLPPFPAPARLHHTLPQNMNVRLANFGPGSSNVFMSDSGQGFSGFPGFGVRPVVDNRAAAANLRNVREDEQNESDLDLSLKL